MFRVDGFAECKMERMGVEMLKLSAFKLGTIQDCMHILNECEAEGITDIRFVRQRLAEYIHTDGLTANINMRRESKQHRKVKISPCPECGSPLNTIAVDGLAIVACKNCRWSGPKDNYQQNMGVSV